MKRGSVYVLLQIFRVDCNSLPRAFLCGVFASHSKTEILQEYEKKKQGAELSE